MVYLLLSTPKLCIQPWNVPIAYTTFSVWIKCPMLYFTCFVCIIDYKTSLDPIQEFALKDYIIHYGYFDCSFLPKM